MYILEKGYMPIRARENLIGAYAFLAGIVLAIILGVFYQSATNAFILIVLALIGVIVGFFVAEKDVQIFLLASVSVVIASFAGIQGMASDVALRGLSVTGIQFGRSITSILGALLFLFVPATIFVALKVVFSISKS